MKKLLFTVSFLILSCLLMSQIIIHEDELVKSGDIIVQSYDEMPDTTIQPGIPGPDQIWDFSGLHEYDMDTLWFMNPDWSPFDSLFPNSNLAMLSIPDSAYIYLEREPDKLSMTGIVVEIDTFGIVPMPIIPGETIAQLPMLYEDTTEESFYQEFKVPLPVVFVDSIWYKMTTTKTAVTDAWGSMTIPLGTFNALRVHTIRTETDSVWIKFPAYGWRYIDSLTVTNTSENYTWWSNDEGTGFMIVDMSMGEMSGDVDEVAYLREMPYQHVPENPPTPNIMVYPVPCRSMVCFEIQDQTYSHLTLFDMYGSLINLYPIKGKNRVIINVSDLMPGMYLYRITKTNKELVDQGKLIKW